MPNANPPRTPDEEFEMLVSGIDPGWITLQDAYLAGYRAALERAAEICREKRRLYTGMDGMSAAQRITSDDCVYAILKELK